MTLKMNEPVEARRRRRKSAESGPSRPQTWRPQPSGLSRDELRQIVLDIVG